MEGDVLLVACGTKVSVRNLRSGMETRAADIAIKRHVSYSFNYDTLDLMSCRLSDVLVIRERRRFPSAITV